MTLTPNQQKEYHVFLASPCDVGAERQCVRLFFDHYNRHTAHLWGVRFEVVDWENYVSIGVGRPQELVTKQTLEKFRKSLVLVIGIMYQRFGTPTSRAESGTEEEFNWAFENYNASGFPDIKWFFRKVDVLEFPVDPEEAEEALEQWKKVRAFRSRMRDANDPVFFTEYSEPKKFTEIFAHDLSLWLADPARPWIVSQTSLQVRANEATAQLRNLELYVEKYRTAVLSRFETLNFEMIDTTGAYYSGVRLYSVFVPQSVRDCHDYNPRLLEVPKEQQQRSLGIGEGLALVSEVSTALADRLRRKEYFQQPLRGVLEVIDHASVINSSEAENKVVILGDPGSGKSSLIRYLALRWARTAISSAKNNYPIPLVIELGQYARWKCKGRKDFTRYLEEAPFWHEWPHGIIDSLLVGKGGVLLLLDGLDEIFDVPTRENVVNDIARFSNQYVAVPIVITSRLIGYQSQRLRDSKFQHYILQDLDRTQISEFITRWHDLTFDDRPQALIKRDRLNEAICKSKPIAMLAGNPLLLTMMAILNRNQDLPRDRADLYAQASRLLLHQWDTERAVSSFPGMSEEIGLGEKNSILRRIAAKMQSGPSGLKGNIIDGQTLTHIIEEYLHSELRLPLARAASRAMVEQLRQRNFILCYVGADCYSFVHRTFLEFYCAAEFVHQFHVSKTLSINDLVALYERHCRDDEWHEVLRLICGQIDEQFVARIVEQLAMHYDDRRIPKGGPSEIPLAINCLSEVRSLGKLASTGSMLAERVMRGYERSHYESIVNDLDNAIRNIGDSWPGVPNLAQSSQRIISKNLKSAHVLRTWPVFVAFVGNDRLLTEKLLIEENSSIRDSALVAMADRWPDQRTRELVEQLSVLHKDERTRITALQILVRKWPDEVTRTLLGTRVVKDESTDARNGALDSMSRTWSDRGIRDLVTLRAMHDESANVRNTAFRILVNKWPTKRTRDLLTHCAVHDKEPEVREYTMRILAQEWPVRRTRDLLDRCAIQDGSAFVRKSALGILAREWQDNRSMNLLIKSAAYDEDAEVRRFAIQAISL